MANANRHNACFTKQQKTSRHDTLQATNTAYNKPLAENTNLKSDRSNALQYANRSMHDFTNNPET